MSNNYEHEFVFSRQIFTALQAAVANPPERNTPPGVTVITHFDQSYPCVGLTHRLGWVGLDWVGLGQSDDGLGWIGSHKMDPWTTLISIAWRLRHSV